MAEREFVACRFRGVLMHLACMSDEETTMTGMFYARGQVDLAQPCERCGKPLADSEGAGENG